MGRSRRTLSGSPRADRDDCGGGDGLKDDAERAIFWAADVRERNAALSREDFGRSFPMKSDAMRVRVLRALGQLGF